MLRASRRFLLCALALLSTAGFAQSVPVTTRLPEFEAASIKPPDPAAPYRKGGFYGEAGGRVFFGGTVKMLVEVAFNLKGSDLRGGPEWIAKQWFEINAVPPDNSPSREINGRNAEPTAEQRLMLQALLRDRFGFKSHLESKEGDIYILTRGRKPLQLKAPKDPGADPRAIVVIKPGVIDGEAMGRNTTVGYLAQMLSRDLQAPVVDQTGITGTYDFYVPPVDPENQDVFVAVFGVVDRLGLAIKRGRGPMQTLVIDHVEQPSAN